MKLLVRGDVVIHSIARWRESYQGDRGVGPHHRRDKSVPAVRDCLDAAALPRPVIEDSAQRRDLHRKVALLDCHARPDRFHDQVFGKKFTLPLDEQPQEIESTRAESHRFRFSGPIEPEKASVLKPKPAVDEESIGQI